MGADRRFPLRLLGLMCAVVALGFGFELYWDVTRSLYPPGHPLAGQRVDLRSLQLTPDLVRQASATIARSYNQLLALTLTFIALAVPITANHYTPKLLRIFLRDRANLAVLAGAGLLSGHSVITLLLSHDLLTPGISFWITVLGALAGWIAIIPYYFYVMHFLNPETIIERVKDSLVREIRALPRAREPRAAQALLHQRITDLGSVILKAIERSDREVAIDATEAMADAFRVYQRGKRQLDPALLAVGRERFTGLSRAALDLVNEERTWVEHKMVGQLQLAYSAALARMPDAVSAITYSVKGLAAASAQAGDRQAFELLLRFLNSFIREALRRKDVRAIYDVFYQYKSLMRRLLGTHPDSVRAMVGYLGYYGRTARQLGLPFIHELASYELAELCETACLEGLPADTAGLLDAVLAMEGVEDSAGLVKSRVILGSFFLERKLEAPASRVVASLAVVPGPVVEQARRELLETERRVFWEITDRQVNFDYVDPSRKARVAELLSRLRD